MLILHRSSRAADPGVWDLPGGQVEQGETLSQAVRREVREETGYDVRVGPMFHAELFRSFSKRGKLRPTVGVFFLCDAPPRKRLRLDPHEHTEYAWIAREQLDDYPTVDYIQRTVRAAFAERGLSELSGPAAASSLPAPGGPSSRASLTA